MALDVDEVGPFFLEARELYRRLTDSGMFDDVNEDAALPDDMLTCDEACRMVSMVIMLSLQLFPALDTQEGIEQAMRDATLRVTPQNVRH